MTTEMTASGAVGLGRGGRLSRKRDLDDGKRFKSLKRHLRTVYDLTPEQYRAKWGLAHDYPMVAPNYAAARSELAKQLGLGARRKKAEPLPAQPVAPARGRRKKAA